MNDYKKIGAISLIIAGLLNVFRIFPILLTPGVTPEQIPPHTLQDTVIISETTAYLLSHIMALLATPLIIVGALSLFQSIKNSSNLIVKQIGLLGLVGVIIGQSLYSLGLVIDGFTLPTLTAEYIQTGANAESQIASMIMGMHHLAMSFAGLGFFTLLMSTGIFGFALYKAENRRKLFIVAISIGAIAIIGYAIGLLDILISSSFEMTYGLLTMMYIYYFIVGIHQINKA